MLFQLPDGILFADGLVAGDERRQRTSRGGHHRELVERERLQLVAARRSASHQHLTPGAGPDQHFVHRLHILQGVAVRGEQLKRLAFKAQLDDVVGVHIVYTPALQLTWADVYLRVDGPVDKQLGLVAVFGLRHGNHATVVTELGSLNGGYPLRNVSNTGQLV